MKKYLLVTLLVCFGTSVNAATIYSDRTSYENDLFNSITDDYSNSGYNFVNSNTGMSAVLGETSYTSTSFVDLNIVSSEQYCSGCNGSFELDFTTTSLGSASGIFGVGLDLFEVKTNDNYAFVTFGNSATQNYLLPTQVYDSTSSTFWGITSSDEISSIHFGLINGGAFTNADSNSQRIFVDNLTIGNQATTVPEPTSIALLGLGLAGLGFSRKKKSS